MISVVDKRWSDISLQSAIGQCIRYLERSLFAYGNRKGRTVVDGTSVTERQARKDKGCVLLLSPERCLVLYGRDFHYVSFDMELLDDTNKSVVQDVETAIHGFAKIVVMCKAMFFFYLCRSLFVVFSLFFIFCFPPLACVSCCHLFFLFYVGGLMLGGCCCCCFVLFSSFVSSFLYCFSFILLYFALVRSALVFSPFC